MLSMNVLGPAHTQVHISLVLCVFRHLVFCLLDLLLELLVPEVSDEDFQNCLLQKLSGNPENSAA